MRTKAWIKTNGEREVKPGNVIISSCTCRFHLYLCYNCITCFVLYMCQTSHKTEINKWQYRSYIYNEMKNKK